MATLFLKDGKFEVTYKPAGSATKETVHLGAITAFDVETENNASIENCLDGRITVGEASASATITTEGFYIPDDMDHALNINELFKKGNYTKATFSGTIDFRKEGSGLVIWTLGGGACGLTESWSYDDQLTYEAEFTANSLEKTITNPKPPSSHELAEFEEE